MSMQAIPTQLLAQMRKYRLGIFLAISATYIVSYFHRAAPAVVGPEIMREFALAPSELGFIGSMYFWAYALTAVPAGLLSDNWGARKTIGVFVLLAAVGGFMFALSHSIALMAAGRFIIGLGVGVVYVAAMRILADWYQPDEMATYSGILIAVGNMGAMISTTPLVMLMAAIGWRNSFTAVAVLTLAGAVLAYAVIRNSPKELGFPSPREVMGLPPMASAARLSLATTLKAVFAKKKFYLVGILQFSFYGTFMGVASLWAGPYLQDTYAMSKAAAGNILMMFPLGMVIGCPLSGYLSDKVFKSRKRILLVGGILHLVTYIPFIMLGDRLTMPILYALFLWYGLSGSSFVSCFACVKEIYEARFAGTAVGALNIFLFTGGAFYQYALGQLIGCFPKLASGGYAFAAYQAVFIAAAAGIGIGLFLFAFFKEERVV